MRFPLPVLTMLLAALTLLLAEGAAAHVVPSHASLQRVDHDTVLTVEFLSDLLMNGSSVPVTVEIVNFTTAKHPEEAWPRLTLHAPPGGGDGETVLDLDAEGSGPGHYRGLALFPAPGTWQVTVEVPSTGARATIPFTVYPYAPWRFQWSPLAGQGFTQSAPARLAFLAVNETHAPHALPQEGVVRMERWSHDLSLKFSETVEPLGPTGRPGEMALEYRFNEPGLYLLHVGAPALGLLPGDRPPFQIYVFPANETGPAPLQAPRAPLEEAGPYAGAVLVIGLLALLPRPWRRRRGR